MATKNKSATPEVHPSVVAIQNVNSQAFAKAMRWADTERRANAATVEAERALSVLVRTADEIAVQAGDIATHAHSGTPTERERHAKKIQRLNEALEKVRVGVAELAAA